MSKIVRNAWHNFTELMSLYFLVLLNDMKLVKWKKAANHPILEPQISKCLVFLLKIDHCNCDQGFPANNTADKILHYAIRHTVSALGSSSSELCFLLCIGPQTLFVWELMLTILSSSVWSQRSLIPEARLPLLSPAWRKCPIILHEYMEQWSASQIPSFHCMLSRLSGALAPADTKSPYWTAMGAKERERRKRERRAAYANRLEGGR